MNLGTNTYTTLSEITLTSTQSYGYDWCKAEAFITITNPTDFGLSTANDEFTYNIGDPT